MKKVKWIKGWLKPPCVGTYTVICEMTKDTKFHQKGDKVVVIDEFGYAGWSLENEVDAAWKVLAWAKMPYPVTYTERRIKR